MSKNDDVPIIMEKGRLLYRPRKGGYLIMKRKARIQTGIDDRLVAIYARKSRITNKGDSIAAPFFNRHNLKRIKYTAYQRKTLTEK